VAISLRRAHRRVRPAHVGSTPACATVPGAAAGSSRRRHGRESDPGDGRGRHSVPRRSPAQPAMPAGKPSLNPTSDAVRICTLRDDCTMGRIMTESGHSDWDESL
jgi:hypothetical protein